MSSVRMSDTEDVDESYLTYGTVFDLDRPSASNYQSSPVLLGNSSTASFSDRELPDITDAPRTRRRSFIEKTRPESMARSSWWDSATPGNNPEPNLYNYAPEFSYNPNDLQGKFVKKTPKNMRLQRRLSAINIQEDGKAPAKDWGGDEEAVPLIRKANKNSFLKKRPSSFARGSHKHSRLLNCLRRGYEKYWVGNISLSATVLLITLGVVSGAVDFAQDQAIFYLRSLRNDMLTSISDENYYTQYVVWVFFGIVMFLIAVLITRFVSPAATGSGIPEMKVILSGTKLENFFSVRTGIAKICGLIFSIAAGLSIGREGPFVHCSALIANGLLHLDIFKHLASRRLICHQIFSAACAVGVSCTFGAPVGGVLFSIEVTMDYYMLSSYWRASLCSISGAFVVNAFRPINRFKEIGISDAEYTFSPREYIFLIFLAVIGGILGGLFVLLHQQIIIVRRRLAHHTSFSFFYRFIFPLLIVLFTGLIVFPFGPWFHQPMSATISDLITKGPLSQFNKGWLSEWGKYGNLTLFIVSHFLLTTISITLPIPCGTFLPVLAVGAALGRLFGEAALDLNSYLSWWHLSAPSNYAIFGAVVMGGGVTRTISTAVIMVEITRNVDVLIPCLFVNVIAIAIGNKISHSIYTSMMEVKELPYLPKISNLDPKREKKAADVMRSEIFCLPRVCTYTQICELMQDKRANVASCPIVDSKDGMYLIGAISRASLQNILFTDLETYFDEVMEKHEIADEIDITTLLTYIDCSLFKNESFDIISHPLSVIDPSPFQAVIVSPLSEIHFLFSMLRCTHIFITDFGKLRGLIIMRDLVKLSSKSAPKS